jgi:mRNA interferase MazF
LIIAVAPGHHPDLLLALITSQMHQAVPNFDEVIDTIDSNFSKTGLKVASLVRLGRLVSVEASVINARLGRISSNRLQGIQGRLAAWILM